MFFNRSLSPIAIGIIFCLLGSLFNPKVAVAQQFFPVKNYGATGVESQNATESIQKAIDACAAAGGGTVYFAPGVYKASTFFLKSKVNLHLERGATLQASRNPADYRFTKGIYSTETDVPILIYADGVSQVAITGAGIIDGKAEHRYSPLEEVDNFIKWETENAKASGIEMKRYYALDPKVCLVYIINSQDVVVQDVQLLHSPNWTLHLANCQRVSVKGIYLFSSLERGVNADGIDIDGCQHVRIEDCTVITGDDAICLKSTNKNGKYTPCEDVVITNSTLQSTSTALKIGTESHGDFRRIHFNNCTVSNTNRGIGIFVRDGATVEDVIFSNLTIECKRVHFNWWGDGDPIHFVLLKRKKESRLGYIRNVLVQNVWAKGEGTSLIAGFEDNLNEGLPTRNLENIIIDNVHITQRKESLADKRANHILYTKAITGLTVRNSTFSWADAAGTEPKWAQGLNVQRVENLLLDGLSTRQGLLKADTSAAIKLLDVKGGVIRNCMAQIGTTTFISVGGKKTSGIFHGGNISPAAKQFLKLEADLPKNAVQKFQW